MEKTLQSKRRRKVLKAKMADEYRVGLGDFVLEQALGKGSFGVVWKARHRKSGKVYALKTLDRASLVKEKLMPHTFLERDMMAMLGQHPFIMDVHYCFQTADSLFLALDYVPGGSLWDQFRDRQAPLSEEETRFFAAEVALAMEAAHSMDYVYRDLKLENILLDEEGHVILSDFGLAYRIKKGGRVKSFSGTPLYLAPEQLDEKGHGREVDFWAFGVLLHILLTLEPPFWDENLEKMFSLITKRRLELAHFGLSPAAASLLQGLMAKSPTERLGHDGGWAAVRSHSFFQGIDWAAVGERRLRPPIRPKVVAASGTLEGEEGLAKPKAGGEGDWEAVKGWDFASHSVREWMDSQVVYVEMKITLHSVTGVWMEEEDTASLLSVTWELQRKAKLITAGESTKIQCGREATEVAWKGAEFQLVFQVPMAEYVTRCPLGRGLPPAAVEKERANEHVAAVRLKRHGHAKTPQLLGTCKLYLWDSISFGGDGAEAEVRHLPSLTKVVDAVAAPGQKEQQRATVMQLKYSVDISCKQKALASASREGTERKGSGGTLRQRFTRAASVWSTSSTTSIPSGSASHKADLPQRSGSLAPPVTAEEKAEEADPLKERSKLVRPVKKKKSKRKLQSSTGKAKQMQALQPPKKPSKPATMRSTSVAAAKAEAEAAAAAEEAPVRPPASKQELDAAFEAFLLEKMRQIDEKQAETPFLSPRAADLLPPAEAAPSEAAPGLPPSAVPSRKVSVPPPRPPKPSAGAFRLAAAPTVPSLSLGNASNWRTSMSNAATSATARHMIAKQVSARGSGNISAAVAQAKSEATPPVTRPSRSATTQVTLRKPVASLSAPIKPVVALPPKPAGRFVPSLVKEKETKTEEKVEDNVEELALELEAALELAEVPQEDESAHFQDLGWLPEMTPTEAAAKAKKEEEEEELSTSGLVEHLETLISTVEVKKSSHPLLKSGTPPVTRVPPPAAAGAGAAGAGAAAAAAAKPAGTGVKVMIKRKPKVNVHVPPTTRPKRPGPPV